MMVELFAQVLVALVIGHPVPVSCADIQPYSGYYSDEPAPRIVIADYLCGYANEQTLTAGSVGLQRFSLFVWVLAHEGAHASGIVDEHLADCAAGRALPSILTEVGRSSKPVKKLRKRIESFAKGLGSKGQCPKPVKK